MSVLVVGLSHRSAPVEVLERAAVAADEIPKLLDEMLRGSHVTEVMMLSTCNRIEVYAVVDAFHGGLGDVSGRARPARRAAAARADRAPLRALRGLRRAAPVRRRRGPGLDGDRRGADPRPAARRLRRRGRGRARSGACCTSCRSRRCGSASGCTRAPASTPRARRSSRRRSPRPPRRWRDLAGARAAVVGAGAMGALAAAHLRRAGAAEIVVLNRSAERAQRLAENTRRTGTPARSAPLDALVDELAAADLTVVCTGAVGTVVSRETVAAAAVAARTAARWPCATSGCPATSTRRSPRCPASRSSTWSSLQRRLAPQRARARPSPRAQELVAEEAQAYLAAQRSAEVTPTVTALRRRASEVVDAELLRLRRAAARADPEVREEFTRTVRRVVDKLLHTPTVQVKRLAEGPDGTSYAEALRELFELDPQTPAAVAAQRSGDVLAALEAPVQAGASCPCGGALVTPHRRTTPGTSAASPPGRRAARAMTPARARPLRIGTRPSALAVAQSELVAARLRAAGHPAELVTVSTPRRPLVRPDPHARRRRVRLAAARRAGRRRGRRRGALLQGPADRARPAADARRGPAAGGPPRRAGRPRRQGARRAAAGIDGRHGLPAPDRPARGARAGSRTGADPGQRRHPARQGRARASWTPWWSPRPGCAGSDASTRPPSCSTRCRCCRRPRRGRSPWSAARRRPRARRAASPGARRRVHPGRRHRRTGGAGHVWRPVAAPRWARWPMWCPT